MNATTIASYIVVGFLFSLSAFLAVKKRHGISAVIAVLAFVGFIFAQLLNVGIYKIQYGLSVEQWVCWFFALAFLALACMFLNEKNLPYAFVIFLFSITTFFCGLSGVQAIIKTHLLGQVTESLKSYGDKIDKFQTTVSDMQAKLIAQQSLLQSNQSVVQAQMTNFQAAIAATRMEITNQLQSIRTLNDTVVAAQGKLDGQQSKLGDLRASLSAQQSTLESQQSLLVSNENAVQAQITIFQTQMAQTRQDITNQLQSAEQLNGKLSIAETNLEDQQKKIGSVESLVQNLYSRTAVELFPLSDSSRVVIQDLKPNTTRIFFLLKDPAVGNSVQGLVQGFGPTESTSPLKMPGQLVKSVFQLVGVSDNYIVNTTIPLTRLGNTNNVAITYFICKRDAIPKGCVFELQYVRDISLTNSFKKVEVKNDKVLFDGQPWSADPNLIGKQAKK